MAERLFSLFRRELERLEIAIVNAEANGSAGQQDVRRLKALRRAVIEQIRSWSRDLGGPEPSHLKSAA